LLLQLRLREISPAAIKRLVLTIATAGLPIATQLWVRDIEVD
jgi:hypothetical protein